MGAARVRRPRARPLASLSLSFLICMLGITVPIPWVVERIEYQKVHSEVDPKREEEWVSIIQLSPLACH